MRLLLRRFPVAGGLLFFALLCSGLVVAQYFRPHGVTITVTNTNDSGPGSFRQALVDVPNGGTIQFSPALNNQTITITSAELIINKRVTITGPRPNLLGVARDDQAPNFRILHILSNHNVEISGLTISNGRLGSEDGGGIFIEEDATVTIINCVISGNTVGVDNPPTTQTGGAGIYNDGTLNLINSTVSNNSATSYWSYGGGGIFSDGTLTITHSTISGNSADMAAGGIGNGGTLTINDSIISNNHATGFGHGSGFGGGISNGGTLMIQNTIISGNTINGEAGYGGGIFGSVTAINCTIEGNTGIQGGGIASLGGVTITNCTIRNNNAIFTGGGIFGGGTISNSTISGNSAQFRAGGIYGSAIISNSTISGNTASQNGQGGGIFGVGTITNCTITGNAATQGGSIYATGPVNLRHTILKAASGANIFNNGGSVISVGYNLSSDNAGGFLTGPGDQINTDPLLGPLQNNGGPTFTHELLTGSPAINAGDPNFTPPPFYDQRDFGYLRVYNGMIDIGSFEAQPLPTVSPTPTPTPTATIPIPTPTPTPCLPVLTQSTSQAIALGNSASCNDGVTHTDNSYWRAFDMNAYANGGQYCVYSASFGVEFANSIQPVTVRLYTTSNFPAGFPGSLTQIATTTFNVGPAQNGTVVTTPLVVTVPAGTPQLVMELFTPSGQPEGHRFFVGSNSAPETGASYFSAAACGATTPITTAALGFPNMHIVFDINGNCTCSPPTPTPSPSASASASASVTPSPVPTLIVTNTNDNGPGSLRLVLDIAQDGDVIGFESELNGQTITLTGGELVINKNITISGPGADLLTVARSAASQFRIFHVLPNHTVLIQGLTITGGMVTGFFDSGGGVFNEESILTIDHCTISNNQASWIGGGVGSTGALAVAHSRVTNNTIIYFGGGIANDSKGVGFLTITDTVVSDNSSLGQGHGGAIGGGIFHTTGTLTLQNSIITGNRALGDGTSGSTGGGIYGSGPMQIVDSTITSNVALGDAGGIYQSGATTITRSTIGQNSTTYRSGAGIHSAADLTITDSTIVGNHAATSGSGYGDGGGIYHRVGMLTVASCTINDNRADGSDYGAEGGGIYTQLGGPVVISNSTFSGNFARVDGGAIANESTLTINNSTFSGNSSDGPAGGIISGEGNVACQIGNTIFKSGKSGANIVSSGKGKITSLGYNLSDDDGGGFLSGPGDLINTDPLLGPLQNNGGPTLTHLLLDGSPAINMGDPNFTPPPSTDQRGYPRVDNGRIDIGSVEIQLVPTPTPTPTPTATPPPSTVQALNISTRLHVETGDNVGIGGFIISGADNLRVAIRGLGPSLGGIGIPDFLPDPTLELRDGSGALINTNDNWQDDPSQAAQLMKLGLAPTNTLESAIVETLAPGAYTAVLAEKNGGTGVGLVEVYNVDQSVPLANIELANISTRGFVQTGNDVMIGGFILGNGTPNPGIIVRGIGPSLTQYGIPNALADPTLELRDNNGALLVANDNWQDDPASAAQLTAHGLAPQNPLEAGIYAELQPGLYTGILAGQASGTGVGLVEVYNVH